MLCFETERELEYKGYHARAEYWENEWVGEVVETGAELNARSLEELEEFFRDSVDFALLAAEMGF